MTKALFFGSFNPVHNGHIQIAQSALSAAQIDEVVLIVSPQNPFKSKAELAPEEHRLKMAELSTQDLPNISVSDIEFRLPKPSFTINTINQLTKKYPDDWFYILMGSDNLNNFSSWKDYQQILDHCRLLLYKRDTEEIPIKTKSAYQLTVLYAPILPFSSTKVRKAIKQGDDISEMVPSSVERYIKQHFLYT